MYQSGELIGSHGCAIERDYPRPTPPLIPQISGRKAHFEIAAKWLEISENAKRAHLRIHWLDTKLMQ